MMYIFPRQFGLHNAFTSPVDFTKTSQKFQDYTIREDEILAKFKHPNGNPKEIKAKLPKRLRGRPQELVRQLQIRHGRCSYTAKLEHYCPISAVLTRSQTSLAMPSNGISATSVEVKASSGSKAGRTRRVKSQPILSVENLHIAELATPTSRVSAFCQAIISEIVPDSFWGDGDIRSHNKGHVLRKINHFITLRRFESMTLQEAITGIKVRNLLRFDYGRL